MRAMVGERAGAQPPTTHTSFRGFSAISLRRHQVASLEHSSEDELHLFDLLHSRLTESLQSLLLPAPFAANSKTPSLILSLPFLHKLLETVLVCVSDFKSLLLLVLSRNPSFISRPPLDRAVPDFLHRCVKSLDLCNVVSLSLQSLRLWNRHADIAAHALHRPDPTVSPPQINRARRALSKLLSASADLTAPSTSCSRVCRICSAKKHLQTVNSGFGSPRSGDPGSAALLALAVQTISALLHFLLWVMVASFPCRCGDVHPSPSIPAGVRHMPWAAAFAQLHEKISEEVRKERKEGGFVTSAGMLSETVSLGRSGREVLVMMSKGDASKEAIMELAVASQTLEEGLGPLESKMREVFHRLVKCREEVLRCLADSSSNSAPPADSM